MFKKNFVKLCNRNHESPTVVCRKLGLSSAAFSEWTETSVPRRATLERIADYFEVTVEALLEDRGERRILRVPIYGKVAAGIPMEAIEEIEDFEELDTRTMPKGEYMALRIAGDSMEPRIRKGDVVIVRVQDDAENGDVAIVMIGNEDAVCKKIKKTKDGMMLISTNPVYEPMFFSNEEIQKLPLRILGRVVELRAKF